MTTNPMLAYWDSFSGLLPCKIIRVEAHPDPNWQDPFGHKYCVIAVLTADRGPYYKGEQIAQSPTHIWPCDCVRSKRGTFGQVKIVASYNWQERCSRL